MQAQNPHPWTLRFSFFGIPVSIHPMSWVVLALLGGAFGVSTSEDLTQTLIFMVAGMLCLLVHEFGHAFTGRATGALVEGVEIAGMGGTTSFLTLPQQRWRYLLVVLAGPLASLVLCGVFGLVFGLQLGNAWAGVQYAYQMPWREYLPMDLQQQLALGLMSREIPAMLLQFYTVGILVCFWWSVFNLLPIFPLDGGKFLGSLLKNYLVPCVLGLVLCTGLAFWAILEAQWFNMLILGYLAYINWQYLRVFRKKK